MTARVVAARAEQTSGQSVSDKMPNLGGIAGAIDKLTSTIEADAQKVLERVDGVHAKRQRVFGKAHERLAARDKALDEADAALDKLDAALGDNGAPTSDGSETPSQG